MKRIVTALAVAVSVTSGVAYAQTAAELLQKAIYLEDSVGDVAQAVAYYRRLLEILPPSSELAATARRRLEAARSREEHQAAPLTASHAPAHLVVATPTPAEIRPSTRTASDRVWFQLLPADTVHVGANGPVLSESARMIAMGVTLRELVGFAYGNQNGTLTRSQVIGGPEWTDTARWDVRVPVPDGTTALVYDADGVVVGGTARPLLQQLLAERFNLVVHRENRQLPVYDMVSGGPGPDLKQSTASCIGDDPSQRCEWRSGLGFVTVQGKTLRHLAVQLSWNFSAITIPVRDRSGLTGKFDYTVSYVPTLLAAPNRAQGNVENPAAGSGPSIVDVLRERLGLRLVERVDTLDVIVIANAQMPS